jgi:hypothetical protein
MLSARSPSCQSSSRRSIITALSLTAVLRGRKEVQMHTAVRFSLPTLNVPAQVLPWL